MKKSQSYPSLSAIGSRVAAASSVAFGVHGQGNTIRLKNSDLVWVGDGEDVKAAIHGSPGEEVSCKKVLPTNITFCLRETKRSSRPESPSSCDEALPTSEASSPLSRNKRRRKQILLVPVVKRSESQPGTVDGREHATKEASTPLCRKNNIIKRIVTVWSPKRSRRPESPSSSNEAQPTSSPLSRKKKRSKRIHLVPAMKRPHAPSSNVSVDEHAIKEASAPLCTKNNIIKRIITVRTLKRSSRSESPSSNTDVKSQSTGETSAYLSRKRKMTKRVLVISQRKEDTAKFIDVPSSGSSSCILPRNQALLEEDMLMSKQKNNDHNQPGYLASQGGSCANRVVAVSADSGKGKNMLMGEEKSQSVVSAYFSGDIIINKADAIEPANEIHPTTLDRHIKRSHAVDNCLDVTERMDQLIPLASHDSSISEESSWMKYKMVVHHKQEVLPEEIQNLLDLDHEAIMTRISFLMDKLNPRPPAEVEFCSTYDEKQLAEVFKRLSRYYIEAHELSSPGKELADAQLNEELDFPLHVYEKVFRQHEKEDPEWYFHPVQCKLAGLDDYQRLVLRDDYMYRDWDYYRLTYHTYQGDLEYVQFCEEMSKEMKWIEDETALFGDQWPRYELVAFHQSLKIAVQFPHILARPVNSGSSEHLDSLRFYFDCRKDWCDVYLEIWKRFAKEKVKFDVVLKQLYEENIFPSRMPEIKSALDNYPGLSLIKYNYENFMDHIDGKLTEEEARLLIIEAVEEMLPKRKNYLDYARKKIEIAARIGLISKSSLEVTAQGGENKGDAKSAIVN